MPGLTRPVAVIGALAASTFLVGTTLAVAAGSGSTIKACAAKSDGALRVVSSAGDCTRHEKSLSWNTRGPAGPSGVVAMASVALPQDTAANTTTTPKFVGTAFPVTFAGGTSVLVTGTLDFHSTNASQMYANLEVCYQQGANAPVVVTFVLPDFAAASSNYFAQTVTGVVKGLAAGIYKVGICTSDESANAGHGFGVYSVMVGRSS